MSLARLLVPLLLLASLPATATTWVSADIDDPLAPGKKCEGQQPASWGSYIYQWESKYDQVFWPHVTAEGVWTCPESGFVAFLGDIELTPAEAQRIGPYLATLSDRRTHSRTDELARLEAIYALRDKDAEFRRWLPRVLAFAYEEVGDTAHAATLRAQAATALRTALAEDIAPALRAEYLFVLAAYAREAGDVAQSEADLAALAAAIDELKGKDADFGAYLRELAATVPRIAPGGKLAPAPELPVETRFSEACIDAVARAADAEADAAAVEVGKVTRSPGELRRTAEAAQQRADALCASREQATASVADDEVAALAIRCASAAAEEAAATADLEAGKAAGEPLEALQRALAAAEARTQSSCADE